MILQENIRVLGWSEEESIERLKEILAFDGNSEKLFEQLQSCGTLASPVDEKHRAIVASSLGVVDKFSSVVEDCPLENESVPVTAGFETLKNDINETQHKMQQYVTNQLEILQQFTVSILKK